MLLNKIIQHLITREGILVVASSPVQVASHTCLEVANSAQGMCPKLRR